MFSQVGRGLPVCNVSGCSFSNRNVRKPVAKIINGFLSGKIVNQGTLLNVTVKTDTTITGGTVAGIIKNKGFLQDITLAEGTMIRDPT